MRPRPPGVVHAHCRRSARFAPVVQPSGDKFTASPALGPRDRRTPQRQQTVSERIVRGIRELRLGSSHGLSPSDAAKPGEVQFDADAEEREKVSLKIDKGKARATDADSIPPVELPPPAALAKLLTNPVPAAPAPTIMLAGVPMQPVEVSALLTRAKAELPMRVQRFPLLGQYQDVFTGEEFTNWLIDNVKMFNGDVDRSVAAARVLTEKLNLLRRLGELGNDFDNAEDAYYQFRPKVGSESARKAFSVLMLPSRRSL